MKIFWKFPEVGPISNEWTFKLMKFPGSEDSNESPLHLWNVASDPMWILLTIYYTW